ncbi:efflux RND transporter periplasmic adaptor subunit [Oscillospiraceae bacterium 50-60]
MKNELMEERGTAPEETAPQAEKKRKKWSLPKGKKPRRRRLIAGAAVILAAALIFSRLQQGDTAQAGANYQPVSVIRQDITVTVSGSGTLAPADAYNVSTLISGAIEEAPFEEDDLVEKGTLLYTLDSGDAQSSVQRANISAAQARLSLEQAREALNPTAPIAGVINEVFVHNGDSVTAGTALAKIMTSRDLSIDFLFPYVAPSEFYVGQSATVFVGDFVDSVPGTVEAVSDSTSVMSNGQEGSSVRVKITNPGVLSDSFKASAAIGSYSSYGQATVSMAGTATVYSAGSGTVTGFNKLAGSNVAKGEVLCTIESETNRAQAENARLSVASANLSAGSAADNLDDYRIESPISGTVIEKKFKAGDKVDGAASGTLAIIYDMSYLKVEMNVNELDIGKVRAGQAVEITAAALMGQTFQGTVERVSVNGTTTSGFTTYPVTIVVEDYGELKPGMNVSATILGDTVENALCVPVGAVNRGNTVLVPGEGAMTEDGAAVADPSKLEERPVTLGRSDDAYIEITSGLSEGETVLILEQTAVMGG